MSPPLCLCLVLLALLWFPLCLQAAEQARPRAREAGVVIGSLPPGPLNAITDVPGVLVGHFTLHEGTRFHTGVTAIRPHAGNLFEERVPASIHVGNGFGKLLGMTQVTELGELETPILLTGTLSVWKTADALTTWMLDQPGMETVRSINPVVGETNDGQLSDIRARPLGFPQVVQALESAHGGPVAEGAVGAGAGTIAFGFKGGIGTSSRQVSLHGLTHTVGVLVQSNYGGDLIIAGVPVGQQLERPDGTNNPGGDGSIMIILATDAPLGPHQLQRLASRTMLGVGRTGSVMSNGSGDYAIAFSTAPEGRRPRSQARLQTVALSNDSLTPLFQATVEATEEAILNSLFKATAIEGHGRRVNALPLPQVLGLLDKAGVLKQP